VSWLGWLDRPPYPFLRSAIVNTKSGKAFRGVLYKRAGGYLVLRQAELLGRGAAAVPLDGETLVPLGEVDFLQLIGAAP
jgi:hypothetical protein